MKWLLFTRDGIAFVLNGGEHGHDAHIHVKKNGNDWRVYIDQCEPWLERKKGNFNGKDKQKILRIVKERRDFLMDRWRKKYGG